MLRCVELLVLICLIECSDYRKCGYFKRSTLRCSRDKLGRVPQNIPHKVTILTIKYDDLSEGFTFPVNKRIKKLYLWNVVIGEEIPSHAFSNLRNLEDLRIQYLPHPAENLTIHPEAFHGLHKLNTVRLINLGVESLPDNMFQDSSKLKQIYITGNNIGRIRRNAFTPLRQIQQLNLMHNKISEIEEGALECVDETYRDPRIYLSNNELTTMPSDIAHEKIKLKIHDNPLLCDCHLHVPPSFSDPLAKCEGPPDLAGTALVSLAGKTTQCVCYIPDIANSGFDSTSPLEPGETLIIRCQEGFSLSSMPELICQEDGSFGDVQMPQCLEDRVEPEVLEDGSLLILSNAFSAFPNAITLRCPENTFVKSCSCVESTCRGVVLDDTWCKVYAAESRPTKGELVCLFGDVLLDHYTHYSTDDVHHFAACREPYQMTACSNYNPMGVSTGHGVLVADEGGICEVECGDFDCELYIRCLIIVEREKCDKFSILNGQVSKDGVEVTTATRFEAGDAVTLTCNEGFELFTYTDFNEDPDMDLESTLLTCVEGDQYDPPFIPECLEVYPECPVREIENVIAYPRWTVEEGQSITLSCKVGFTGEPETEIVRCEQGGVFEPPTISCTRKELAECFVPAVPHSLIFLSDGSRLTEFTVVEGTVIMVNCESGYRPNTYRDSLTCLRNGELSDEMPECVEVEDPRDKQCTVPRLRNGFAEDYEVGEQISPGTVVTFQCKDGYRFQNPNHIAIECVSHQYFEPARLPRCKREEMRCQVPELEFGYYSGYRIGESILQGEVLYPVCDYGYDLLGPDRLDCIEPDFGGAKNRCVRPSVNCVIPIIEHGYVMNEGADFREGEYFPIVCDRGYYNAYTYVTCVVGPSFYDPYSVPDCLRPEYGCPKVGFPLMKPLLEEPERGDSVDVECMEGYTLVGQSTLTCGQNFDYTARKLPECVPTSGCEAITVENGQTNSTSSHFEKGERVQITCDPGYGLYGDFVVACENGNWSGIVIPECRPEDELGRDCDLPIDLTGMGSYWPLADGFLNPGSTLILNCDEGFRVSGDNDKFICVTGDRFEPENLPVCEESEVAGCPSPNVPYAWLDPETTVQIGEIVYVECYDGYDLIGESELECQADGRFEELPLCEERVAQCRVPDISNALISPSYPIYEGEMFLVVCERGHELVGSEELFCGPDGEASPYPLDYPECIYLPGPCDLPRVLNGWATYDDELVEIPFRDRLIVVCNKNFVPVQTMVTCMGNDVWEPPIPTCTYDGPTCEIPTIQNGMVSPRLEYASPGQMIIVSCKEGYEKNPRVDLTCRLVGDVAMYDNNPPVCEPTRMTCVTPHIQYGHIEGPDPLLTDDRFTVVCNEGYELVGQGGPLVCFQGETYSRNLPSCQRTNLNVTSCDKPYIQNAEVTGEPTTGHYINVICDEGYYIQGEGSLLCLHTGEYDQDFPQCIRRDPGEEWQCGQRSLSSPLIGRYSDLSDTDFGGAEDFDEDPSEVPAVSIIDGTDASENEFPWNVKIEFTQGRFCGGTVVSKLWVMTAGHCLLDDFHQRCNNRADDNRCVTMHKSDVRRVIAGMHNQEVLTEERQERVAADIIVHPYFVSHANYIDYDVGLIKLTEPLVYNERVNRVCLPKSVSTLVGNTELYIAGWGRTNSSFQSYILQKATVPYVSREICNQPRSYNSLITETMFCAGYQQGRRDACAGDSGGPLVYLGSNGTFEQGGIISWGRYCAMENFYGVYTNLPYFYDWIMSYIKEN